MNKNLNLRLGQQNSQLDMNPESMLRHDLFEIDRKRKQLLDEVEALRKKKYEELDALKRIDAQKSALLKELMNAQEAIDKHRAVIRQMDKEMITGVKPRGAHSSFHPHPLQQAQDQQQRFRGQHYPAHYPVPPAPHHLSRGYPPPPQSLQAAHLSHASASHHVQQRTQSLMEAAAGGGSSTHGQHQGYNQIPQKVYPPPPHLYNQQQQRSHHHEQGFNKGPTYGGHVPPATRQPQAFSKPITRQPNTGWIPPPEFHRRLSGGHEGHQVAGERRGSTPSQSSAGLLSVINNSASWSSMSSTASASMASGLSRPLGVPLESAAATPSNGKVLTVDIFCKNCRKEANFMCSACKGVHYCSIDCQVTKFYFQSITF